MKTLLKLMVLSLFFLMTKPLDAETIYKFQVDDEEASVLNSVSDKIVGLSSKKGWPVQTGERDVMPNPEGVLFIHTETNKRKEGLDSIIVLKYKVLEFRLNGQEFSGTLPDIKFEKCTLFSVTQTKISGSIPNLILPNCVEIDLRINEFSGEIPNLKLNNLEILDLGSNKLTGALKDLELPGLKVLHLDNNRLAGEIINFTKMPILEDLWINYNLFSSIDSKFSHPKIKILEYLVAYGDTTMLSGQMPQFNCPELEKLFIPNSKLTGSISGLKLPNCKSISLYSNNLTGEIPNFQMPFLESLYLMFNSFSGEVPSFEGCPNLKVINLNNNELTSINPSFNPGKLENLSIKSNMLTGSILALNIPTLRILDLSDNNLSGVLPVFILPALEELNLKNNKITGDLPELDMPNLRIFNMENNSLNGKISNFNSKNLETLNLSLNFWIKGPLPAFDLPKLKELIIVGDIEGSLPVMNLPVAKKIILSGNNMSGELPPIDYPKVEYFNLASNNFTGNIPSVNLPAAVEFSLSSNKLSGKIPSLNLPNVTTINLYNNQFVGGFDNGVYPSLKSLSIYNNDLDTLTNLKSKYPNLNTLQVQKNKFQFNHIELNLGVTNLTYSPQDSIYHYKQSLGVLTRFYVLTGGSQNQYQWRKKGVNSTWVDIPNATQSSYTTTFIKGDEYCCKVTSPLAPKLTLYSKLAEEPSCIALGMFDICNESGEWGNGEKNELVATGKVKINDFINFEGAFTVDTMKLSVKANGSFYLTEIPLPGGSQIGRFNLAEGEYELSLLGDSGVITNFLNGKIKEYSKIAGIDLKIEKLKLLGGRSANGVGLDIKLGIPGIAGKCDGISDDDANAEVTLKGLKISTNGFSMDGVKIENMSMFIKDFCIKKLEAGYDREKNEISAAADIQLPFGQVAGGFKLIDGLIDSIGWRLEATKPPFVLGTTTIGVKGFFGHISSITQPAIEVELGGIFGDIISDDLYTVDASGRTIWPTLFEVKGDGKFMRPPKLGLPYQLNSAVTMTYDHPLSQFKVGFDGKIGTSDEKEWLMTAQGEFKISAKTSPPKFAGTLTGEMSLPKFGDGFPYSWLESIAPFPLKGSTNATFVWGNTHLLHGDVSFKLKTFGTFKLKYVADLSKRYGSEDFLWFETDVSLTSKSLRSASDVVLQEVVIPVNTEYAVIRVSGKTDLPVSGLVNPSGKKIAGTSETDNVLNSNSSAGKEAYWTLLNPVPGKWNVEIQNKAVDDSVFVYLKKAESDFSINLSQTGNTVTVTWDKTLFGQGYNIYLMLDEDNQNFDGFSVAEGLANTGSLTFELSNQLNSCSYYLFAQVQGAKETYSKYAKEKLINTKSILIPPVDVSANFDSNTNLTKVRYSDNLDLNTVGYIITVRDSMGRDSVYAVVNRKNGSIDLNIKDASKCTFYFTSYGENGLMGCPSEPELISGLFDVTVDEVESISVYPNPVRDFATISFYHKYNEHYDINITDITGRIVAKPASGLSNAGINNIEWNTGKLQNGIYLIVLKTGSEFKTVKCILRK